MANNIAKDSAFDPLKEDTGEAVKKWLSDNAGTYKMLEETVSDQTRMSQLGDISDRINRDLSYYRSVSKYAKQKEEQEKAVTVVRAKALSETKDPLQKARISIMTGDELADWIDSSNAAKKAFSESPAYKALKNAESPNNGYEAGKRAIDNLKEATGNLLGAESLPLDNISGALFFKPLPGMIILHRLSMGCWIATEKFMVVGTNEASRTP